MFDVKGRLIGITTFKIKGAENVNFAIDASYIGASHNALVAADLIKLSLPQPTDEAARRDSRLISSDAFPKWIASQPSVGSTPFSETLIQKVQDDMQAGHLFGPGDAEFDRVIRQFLASAHPTPTKAAQDTAQPDAYVISCVVRSESGRAMDFKALIDIGHSLVNKQPAMVTDTEVTWSYGEGGKYTSVLDRYSGRVSTSAPGFPNFQTGMCEKLTSRKF